MKVKELIEELNKIDLDLDIIIQKDGEGNGCSPLDGVDDNAIYEASDSYSGDVYDVQWSADEADMEEEEWLEFKEETPRVVVLFPVN